MPKYKITDFMSFNTIRRLLNLSPVLIACVPMILWAADPVEPKEALPKELTSKQLLQLIREKSPRYALPSTRIEAAEADIVAAGVLPNPTVSYGRYDQAAGRANTQFDGPSQQAVTVEVPLLLAGQREARRNAAERKVDAVTTDIETERNRLLSDAWRLYVQLQAAQQRLNVLTGSKQELEHLKTIIGGKQEAGTASQYDVMRISQEILSLETRLENTKTDLKSISGSLGVLLGFTSWQPKPLDPLTPMGTSTDINQLWQQAQLNNPELETAQREIIAADAGLERAKRERWPVPSIQMGTAFTDKPYGMTSFAGVSVEIPIFDFGQGGMAKASADRHATQLKHELLLASVRQEIERTSDVLKSRREILVKFEHEVLAPLNTLKQMSEDAYSLGKSGLLELLDATRTRNDIKLNHIELLVSELDAEIDTILATGLVINALEMKSH